MKRLSTLLMLALLIGGCYKDEVDVSRLTNNPFDPQYVGPPVFEGQGTSLQQVNIGGATVLYQIIAFRVRSELFLSPATYGVEVRDQQSGQVQVLSPDPPGSDQFRYRRAPLPGQPVCVELRLSNDQSTARAETLCVTL